MFPVVANGGTRTTNTVAPPCNIVATVPLNFTTFSERFAEKLEPEIVTSDPQKPELMLVDRIRGFLSSKTLKSKGDSADLEFTLTVIDPEVAPVGTVTVNETEVAAVIVALALPKLTELLDSVVEKFFPIMRTEEPTAALSGTTDTISGFRLPTFESSDSHEVSINALAINPVNITIRFDFSFFITLK
jgi:hypothetical protein